MGPTPALADRPDSRRDPHIAAELAASASRENFPVALRLLPRTPRADLLALYAFARTVDDLGDEARATTHEGSVAADRVLVLGALRDALVEAGSTESAPTAARCEAHEGAGRRARDLLGEAAWASAVEPILAVLRRRALDVAPLVDLVDANLRDQVQHRYDRFEDLLDYCTQSANPVGRVVLGIFELDTPLTRGYSDQICSALQVVEHLQDLREDWQRGRVYLPLADLARFGVDEEALAAASAVPSLRRLVAWEASRAAALLEAGTPLVAVARGAARVALAGFVAGGRATLEAIADAGYDTLATQVRPSPAAVARRAAGLVVAPRRAWRLA